MSNYILAMVSIVYALVCLTKEAEQGSCSTSVEDCSKKCAEGKLGTMTLTEQKKLKLIH
jgi:hypothetical protein